MCRSRLTATPSQSDEHIFSRSQQQKGWRMTVMTISLPQLTPRSRNPLLLQSISAAPHMTGSFTQDRLEIFPLQLLRGFLLASRHTVPYCAASPTFTHSASDGPEQSLGRSEPITLQGYRTSPSSANLDAAARVYTPFLTLTASVASLEENPVELLIRFSTFSLRVKNETELVDGTRLAEGSVVICRSRVHRNTKTSGFSFSLNATTKTVPDALVRRVFEAIRIAERNAWVGLRTWISSLV